MAGTCVARKMARVSVLKGLARCLQVRLHTDKESGRSKGYAHVHFPDEASLEKAVGKSCMDFYGRNLKIGFAQKKKT